MSVALDRHIEMIDDVRGGKPCIAGTRIAVADVALLHLQAGQSLAEIAAVYHFPLAAAYAAMAYYYDHQREIDARVAADAAFVDALQRDTPSRIAVKLHVTPDG